jgi:hypothetical protein
MAAICARSTNVCTRTGIASSNANAATLDAAVADKTPNVPHCSFASPPVTSAIASKLLELHAAVGAALDEFELELL